MEEMKTTVNAEMIIGGVIEAAATASSSAASNESYEDYFDPRFPRWLSLVLFVVGIFGNTLSLIVFLNKNMRKNSTFVYLAFLSIVDLFVLAFGLGDIIMISYFKIILRNHSFVICRVHSFLTYACTHLSSFILASVSIDRAIATNLINFAKKYCKPNMAYKVIVINCLIVIIVNFHSLLFLGYEQVKIKSQNETDLLYLNQSMFSKTPFEQTEFACASQNGTIYDIFLDPYFAWIDLMFYAILPFITMAICTFLILRVLFTSANRLNKKHQKPPTPKPLPKPVEVIKNNQEQDLLQDAPITPLVQGSCSKDPDRMSTGSLNSKINQPITAATNNVKKKSAAVKRNNVRMNKTLHLTYTLVTINALFFALVSPLVITLILVRGKDKIEAYKILINIVYLLAYSNHSFNFLFYGVSSPPFRESLLKLFRLKTENERFNNKTEVVNLNTTL